MSEGFAVESPPTPSTAPIARHLLPDSAGVVDGELVVGGVAVSALAEEFGTPLFIYDEDHLRARAREAVTAFGGGAAYASKAFLCKAMAALVAEEGMQVDVATGGELDVVIAAGVDPRRVVFHGNNKSDFEISSLLGIGVGRIVVDSFDEIERLSRVKPPGDAVLNVSVRATPGVNAHTHEFVMTGQEDSKFGFSVASGAATAAVAALREVAWLHVDGVHAHIGSQIFLLEAFEEEVSILGPFLAENGLAELSVGGGLGVAYLNSEHAPTITEWAATIHDACRRAGIPDEVEVGAEPGRAVAAAAAMTCYRVGTVKQLEGIRTYVAVDGGMSDNPRPVLYGSGYEAFVPTRVEASRPQPVRIVGKHCESGDVLVNDGRVPADLAVGDLLVTPVTGAYGYSMASNYNRLPRPAVLFVANGSARVVIRRERSDDLLPAGALIGYRVAVTNEAHRSKSDESGVIRVGLLGCGNVGGALVEILDRDGDAIARHLGVRLLVTRVAVRSISNARVGAVGRQRLARDPHAVVVDPNVDVVVELIGGIEPARELITEALKAGKPVVTGNKELLSTYGSELFATAAASGQPLAFEAAVGGAIPLIRALAVSLAGEPVMRVMGIVNGTTNFILSQMSDEGITYAEALGEAQRLGFAERDPSADVEGFDASAKAAILASLAFDADVVAGDVYREGIDKIELADIDFARRLGFTVKLLAVAERVSDPAAADTEIAVRVHPAMLPVAHPLAGVRGPFNAIFLEGAHAGELMLYGRGAGGVPTASAVLGDLIEVASNLRSGVRPRSTQRDEVTIRPIDDLMTQYYVTLDVADRPGVLAAVAAAFGAHSVSIRSMEQVGLGAEARLVFITHVAREADLQATLAELGRLDAVERIGGLLRVIGADQ